MDTYSLKIDVEKYIEGVDTTVSKHQKQFRELAAQEIIKISKNVEYEIIHEGAGGARTFISTIIAEAEQAQLCVMPRIISIEDHANVVVEIIDLFWDDIQESQNKLDELTGINLYFGGELKYKNNKKLQRFRSSIRKGLIERRGRDSIDIFLISKEELEIGA